MKKIEPFIVIFIVILIAAASGWLWYSQNGAEKYTGPVEKIKLGAELSILPSAVWVAEKKGYFKEQGLDVEITGFDSGKTALKTMLEKGGLDIVTAAQTPVVLNSFNRKDYAIVSAMAFSFNDVKLLARTDKNISGPKDLKGKRVGVTTNSTGHFFLDLLLNYHEYGISDVEIVDFKATELAPAISEGSVDAISAWEPHISNAEKLLNGEFVLFKTENIFREDFYFISNTDFIKTKPRVIERFLKAIEKAEKFILENREESISIVADRIKADREIVTGVWDDFEFRLFLDQATIISLEDEARWATRNKMAEKTEIPNYLDYIYFKTLERVNPDAVKIKAHP